MATPYRQLELRRGLRANLPVLADGEPGFCTDTGELFVGFGGTNYKVNTDYDPAIDMNWAGTPPATIYQALDRLAAAIVAFTGNPIP